MHVRWRAARQPMILVLSPSRSGNSRYHHLCWRFLVKDVAVRSYRTDPVQVRSYCWRFLFTSSCCLSVEGIIVFYLKKKTVEGMLTRGVSVELSFLGGDRHRSRHGLDAPFCTRCEFCIVFVAFVMTILRIGIVSRKIPF